MLDVFIHLLFHLILLLFTFTSYHLFSDTIFYFHLVTSLNSSALYCHVKLEFLIVTWSLHNFAYSMESQLNMYRGFLNIWILLTVKYSRFSEQSGLLMLMVGP